LPTADEAAALDAVLRVLAEQLAEEAKDEDA
jgi:hypothetical protein